MRKVESASSVQTAVISTFPASFPNSEVLAAPAGLTFEYPATSVLVAFSPLLTSESLAEQIAHLHATPIEAAEAKSYKAGRECHEVPTCD